MVNGLKVLGIIPARGGSKGIYKKNLRVICGKSLIRWTIEQAQHAELLDHFILSSEDEEIIRIAKEAGCDVPFVRPPELSSDTTSGMAPVLHAIAQLPQYDIAVLLQPTSPLRLPSDINACVEKCVFNPALSCVSVSEVRQHPYWSYTIDAKGGLSPFLLRDEDISRRQDLPPVFALNGAVFVATYQSLKKSKSFLGAGTIAHIMPLERGIDIDTEEDLVLAEALLSKQLHRSPGVRA
jgi:CMP-N,N'-diacetyllegionaminic acid synthase